MSSIDTNYGSAALQTAMMKKARDAQGQIALAMIDGAAQGAQTAQAEGAQAAARVTAHAQVHAPQEVAAGHVDTYA